jgi:toxin ParE1/3/4
MILPVLWSETALEDVEEMATFIARDNPAAADRMTDLIFEAGEKLGLGPLLYRAGREPGTREAVVHPNYILVYRIQDDAIRVLRLLHARRQYP